MADRILDLIQKGDWTEEEGAQFERDVFIGFYSVRKLFEAPAKVSAETRALKLTMTYFPKRAGQPVVDWYNRNEISELYDLEAANSEERDGLFVANRMIHSFIFVPSAPCEEDPSDGIFFTSDRDKDRRLYFIETCEIVRLFREVGEDYPEIEIQRDRTSGEMKVRAFKPING